MGSGIAEVAAAAGVAVTLYEPEQAPLERSRQRLGDSVARAVEGGRRTSEDAEALIGRIAYTSSLDELAGADAAIEAVFEDVRVKGEIFKQLDTVLPDARFGARTPHRSRWRSPPRHRPERRVVGLHLFSPVPVMKLVEVVVAMDTAPGRSRSSAAFVSQIGKQSILTKDRAGFVVNMLLAPSLVAGVRMYEEGSPAREESTRDAPGLWPRSNPRGLCDRHRVRSCCRPCATRSTTSSNVPSTPHHRCSNAWSSPGHLGRKSGRGFYEDYQQLGAA